MDCQNTTKTLKINKNKSIGEVIIVVEGESTEFDLLKHIFTKILNYNYYSYKRNKSLRHEFVSTTNPRNKILILNTDSSSSKSIFADKEYKDKVYQFIKTECESDIRYAHIYFLWDRDEESKGEKYLKDAIKMYSNSIDNEEEMNGLFLLSYPCLEAYNISNFDKKLWMKTYETSEECKKTFNSSKIYSLKKINEKTILLAAENMHRVMKEFNINEYNTDSFKLVNEKIYKIEDKIFKESNCFRALSLISIMLIDLGIIIEKEL